MSDEQQPKRLGELIGGDPRRGRGLETIEQYKARCKAEGDRNRARVERLREVIQKLKASRNPEAESGLLRSARELEHPDLDGLITAIKARGEQATVARGGYKRSRET